MEHAPGTKTHSRQKQVRSPSGSVYRQLPMLQVQVAGVHVLPNANPVGWRAHDHIRDVYQMRQPLEVLTLTTWFALHCIYSSWSPCAFILACRLDSNNEAEEFPGQFCSALDAHDAPCCGTRAGAESPPRWLWWFAFLFFRIFRCNKFIWIRRLIIRRCDLFSTTRRPRRLLRRRVKQHPLHLHLQVHFVRLKPLLLLRLRYRLVLLILPPPTLPAIWFIVFLFWAAAVIAFIDASDEAFWSSTFSGGGRNSAWLGGSADVEWLVIASPVITFTGSLIFKCYIFLFFYFITLCFVFFYFF